ncbi:DUF2239 family protein [Cupriavidus gilardii]|uniref:DUF2239 family protein n=1 Tax=Cupriavidus gilardii TaxID=82541 RepID=A0A849B7S9_9BURK|nr:DUF2239 family protein [Cupriavidus gilardii]KAB0597468.1 DUF2239 family protein [Cupriavidus gilardii]MCT9014441.1 DUF2239 family protein [Cupriavidus gilardii]MCT9054161.1 DUF2239 family protein [Cupriavidus gilardii]MCT9117952.1 DUF2239 family protein [Cupriavidus gilardii]NNH10184.1 DUF2239 family protein [Cupriavidus gilardii]
MSKPATCTAFIGERLLASGAPGAVALAVKRALAQRGDDASAPAVLAFDDRSGRQIDFDLRGTDQEIVARLQPEGRQPAAEQTEREGEASRGEPRTPGRPRLGVVAREVTLLPRHWEWLAAQPGGASVTLRKLVEQARAQDGGRQAIREAQQAADRFMLAMLGNQPGYEDASRALYAGDGERFVMLTESWPRDLRDHVRRLAAAALQGSEVLPDLAKRLAASGGKAS